MKILIPFAKQSPRKMKTRGKYKDGWPRGAVIHHTAGRDGAQKTIDGGIKNGYTFLCIQKDGELVQAHNVDEWGYHSGKSAWGKLARAALTKLGLAKNFKELSGTVSDELIGIETNGAGLLKKQPDGTYKTWYGVTIPRENVRYSPGIANQMKGYYEKFTEAQEAEIVDTLMWLKAEAPRIFDFDLCLGHDEISGVRGIGVFRKNDPGGSLSGTMGQFREFLHEEYFHRDAGGKKRSFSAWVKERDAPILKLT